MNTPTVADFKAYFVRDFPYGLTPDYVMDADIQNALNETGIVFATGLFPDQTSFTTGYLYLTAHTLVTNLRNSSQGVAGQYSWLQASKGVGSVSESSAIPSRILENPLLASFSKTNYGAKYLLMIIPQLVGQIFTVCGGTQP